MKLKMRRQDHFKKAKPPSSSINESGGFKMYRYNSPLDPVVTATIGWLN
jgi:hypothetical protein